MGLSVTVNDGTSSRNIVAFTSLDGNVTSRRPIPLPPHPPERKRPDAR